MMEQNARRWEFLMAAVEPGSQEHDLLDAASAELEVTENCLKEAEFLTKCIDLAIARFCSKKS